MNRNQLLLLLTLGALTVFLGAVMHLTHSWRTSTRSKLRRPDEIDRRHLSNQLGTVKIDFYRTYEVVGFGRFKRTRYSIQEWRIWQELNSINDWYEGRVKFEMGDIITYNNPSLHVSKDCGAVTAFSTSGDVRNPNRISAVYIKKYDSTLFGCATFDVPLGGKDGRPPAVMMAMSNNVPFYQFSFLGLTIFGGITLAHEIGHVMGLDHTSGKTEGEQFYNECGLDLRYPRLSRVDLDDHEVPSRTGETYKASDWNGRSNIMTTFTPETHLTDLDGIGIFESNYANIFESIIQCWFNRSSTSEGIPVDQKHTSLHGHHGGGFAAVP